MANSHPQEVVRFRNIEMPTRERILSLIKILNNFDEEKPIKKKEITHLLYFEYCNYILSQLGKELQRNSSAYLSEAEDLIFSLKNYYDNEELISERFIYSSADTTTENSHGNNSILTKQEHKGKISRLIEIAESCSENSGKNSIFKKLIGALYDINDGIITNCVSSATLAADLSVLMDEDYDYVRSTDRVGTAPSNRGVYGRFEYNLLDVWQLKILIETMSGISFLRSSDVDKLNDTILHVTSAGKLNEALLICHRLDEEYYSNSSIFRDNLKRLIEAHISEHNVTFNYRHSTVNRNEKVLDQNSPYTVYPVDIVFKDSFFYLLGANDNGVRPYRIDRIIDLCQANYNPSYLHKYPDYLKEKELFYKNNTNNFNGGDEVTVTVQWDYNILKYYTPLFDVFGYGNISQGSSEDLFNIKTRDNYGMYLNLLRLGPVIQVTDPPEIADKYYDLVTQMYLKGKSKYRPKDQTKDQSSEN